ncbi:hypothetical protein GBF35_43645 [Nonomuraea phyllanthi]|uniref:hypothetical protein n=1 Tax=Nonomuraea phyllanthi TaxID=2219224 RepID=UPI001292DE4E|nr:hypothetical protein [Nonomuraea phyllanthi]QFY12560.1 hypothetical protein GBF35_43645 [Nonomuraea phyllanthi]
MTGAELQELLEVTNGDLRRVVARAALLLDVAGRQLSTLRSTYPAWSIERQRDDVGRVWWTAVLRTPFTVEMAAAGVWRPCGSRTPSRWRRRWPGSRPCSTPSAAGRGCLMTETAGAAYRQMVRLLEVLESTYV